MIMLMRAVSRVEVKRVTRNDSKGYEKHPPENWGREVENNIFQENIVGNKMVFEDDHHTKMRA